MKSWAHLIHGPRTCWVDQTNTGSSLVPVGRALPAVAWLGVLAAVGFEVELFGEGGEQAGLPFGLAGDGAGGAVGVEVEE
jgi:hypothetical protein